MVISNCVINLAAEKDAVYHEIFRILRPAGRLAISDITLSEPIDPELHDRFTASWAGCMGGAAPRDGRASLACRRTGRGKYLRDEAGPGHGSSELH